MGAIDVTEPILIQCKALCQFESILHTHFNKYSKNIYTMAIISVNSYDHTSDCLSVSLVRTIAIKRIDRITSSIM